MAQLMWAWGEQETGESADERDGAGGDISQTEAERGVQGSQGLPVFTHVLLQMESEYLV